MMAPSQTFGRFQRRVRSGMGDLPLPCVLGTGSRIPRSC